MTSVSPSNPSLGGAIPGPERADRNALSRRARRFTQGTPAVSWPYSLSSIDRQDVDDVGLGQSLVVSGDRLSGARAIRPILATRTDAEDRAVSASYS